MSIASDKTAIKLRSGLTAPRLLPGPMEGAMSRVFCAAMNSLELAGTWITPFIRLTTARPRDRKLLNFIEPFKYPGAPLIVQLMGNKPNLLADTAKRLLELGADGINLNFACPSPVVVKNNSGGALLKDLTLLRNIVETVAAAVDKSFSIKIRSGFADIAELPEIMRAFADYSARLDFIAVHFRTVAEQYATIPGRAERLQQAVENAAGIPVIGSGNVYSVNDVKQLFDSGCAGAMAARGLMRDPYLLRRATAELAGGQLDVFVEQGRRLFFNRMLELARREPETYWKRAKFMETANMMWGSDSAEFKRLLALRNAEFLNQRY